ncbi:MAG TPA: hypothetical protein DDY70_05450 [Clostridiales bacterium]|nr:hypothetical protein [Clostridiales bacterium]
MLSSFRFLFVGCEGFIWCLAEQIFACRVCYAFTIPPALRATSLYTREALLYARSLRFCEHFDLPKYKHKGGFIYCTVLLKTSRIFRLGEMLMLGAERYRSGNFWGAKRGCRWATPFAYR